MNGSAHVLLLFSPLKIKFYYVNFFLQWKKKYVSIVFSGNIIFDIDDGKYADLTAPPSVHFTMIFNSFVMMTIFNEINARKIHGQRNVFIGLFTNPIYYTIWIATFIGQVLLLLGPPKLIKKCHKYSMYHTILSRVEIKADLTFQNVN